MAQTVVVAAVVVVVHYQSLKLKKMSIRSSASSTVAQVRLLVFIADLIVVAFKPMPLKYADNDYEP
jgi:hypothetical protein